MNEWLCEITHDGAPCRVCPVCEHLMANPTGNVFTCSNCDFIATDHTLDRIAEVTRSSKAHTTGA